MEEEGIWCKGKEDHEYFDWILRWDGFYVCRGYERHTATNKNLVKGHPFLCVSPKLLIRW